MDEVAVFRQFRVGGAEVVHYYRRHFGEERLGQSQAAAVANGPADDPAQHIAAPLVARYHAIANQESGGPGVFGHYPQGIIGLPVDAVIPAAELHRPVDNGTEQVRFIDIGLVLQDGGGPFQAHAGVHAGGGQGRTLTLSVLIELHKDQVPQFYEPLAVAVGMAAGRGFPLAGCQFPAELGGKLLRRH